MFSCNRAHELDSGCEDESNCALSKSTVLYRETQNDKEQGRCATLLGTDEMLWTGNRRASDKSEWFFSPLRQKKVRAATSNLSSEPCKHFNTPASFTDLLKTVQRGVTRSL